MTPFAALLPRYAGIDPAPVLTHAEPEPVHVCLSARFTDVDITEWYHESVDYAVMKGLMNGVASEKRKGRIT